MFTMVIIVSLLSGGEMRFDVPMGDDPDLCERMSRIPGVAWNFPDHTVRSMSVRCQTSL